MALVDKHPYYLLDFWVPNVVIVKRPSELNQAKGLRRVVLRFSKMKSCNCTGKYYACEGRDGPDDTGDCNGRSLGSLRYGANA